MLEPKKDENGRTYYEQTPENREELYYKHFPEEKPKFYDLRKKMNYYSDKLTPFVPAIWACMALYLFYTRPGSWEFILAIGTMIVSYRNIFKRK